MKRLRHTDFSAYLRYMQMSDRTVFVFVEGKRSDRYFYSRIAAAVCDPRGIGFQQATAEELPDGAGGKDALLKFHGWLDVSGQLFSDLRGKRTLATFFVDKDIDDIIHKKSNSGHVIYTRCYDVEGEIFAQGKLVAALAAAAGFGEAEVASDLGTESDWKRKCAEQWKEWITICIFCKKYKVPKMPGFGVSSKVNEQEFGKVDPSKLTTHLGEMQKKSGFVRYKFDRAYGATARLVEYMFSRGRHEDIFKGKWYTGFALTAVRRMAAGRSADEAAVNKGLVAALLLTIDFSGPWTPHYMRPLSVLLDRL